MGRRYANILETVGRTPVVRINRMAPPHVDLFVKIEAFFTLNKFGDALDHAKAASAAIADMQRWASDGVWTYGNKALTDKISLEIQQAQLSLATTCRNCHITHRVHVLTSPLTYEIR